VPRNRKWLYIIYIYILSYIQLYKCIYNYIYKYTWMWVIMGYRLYKGVYRALYSTCLVESCLPDPVSQSQGLREFWRRLHYEVHWSPIFLLIKSSAVHFVPGFSPFFLGSPYDGRHGARNPSSIVAGSEDRWLPRNHAMSYVAGILVTALGGHWTCLWPMWLCDYVEDAWRYV
jgi:hypothetical protein